MYLASHSPPITVTRADLFDQVWAQPMTKVAAIYRVSATAVMKACRKAAVPVPPQGYWNKIQCGKPVPQRPPLPPAPKGHQDIITIQPSNPPPGFGEVAAEAVARWQAWAEQVAADLDPLGGGLTEFLKAQDVAANQAADAQPSTALRFSYQPL